MNGNDFAKQLLLDKVFRKSHEEKAFWRGRVKADDLDEIFSWSQLNACLSFNRITNDRFRLSANREHEVVNKRAFRAGKDGFGRTTDYLIISELHKLMREGATAVLEAVNELSASVSDLTERLGRELQAQSSANAYISFGDTSGFGVHNDDHDVVVLQLDGCKKWQFFRSPVDGRMATVADTTAPTEVDRGEVIIASAGDVMFIPKGTWHDVAALNEKSLHLTISIVYPTVADFFIWALKHQKYGAPFMDIRPSKEQEKFILQECGNYLRKLPSVENLHTFIRSFYASRACSRVAASFPLLNKAFPNDEFKRIPCEVVTLKRASENGIEAFALGKTHSLSVEEHHVLSQIPALGAMTGQEIALVGGGWEAVEPILESLLDRGLVGKVTSHA